MRSVDIRPDVRPVLQPYPGKHELWGKFCRFYYVYMIRLLKENGPRFNSGRGS